MEVIHGDGGGLVTIFDALVIARWIHFASVFTLFGSAIFWFYIGDRPWSTGPAGLPRSILATKKLLRVAAPIAAVSGVVWLAGILANMTGGFGNVFDIATLRLFFMETQFGTVAILRLILLAMAVLVSLLPWRNRPWFFALLHIGALLLIDQAWLGHAAEGGAGLYGTLMIITYSIHMLAAAAWVGGLPPLLFALVEQHGANAQEARKRAFDLCARYSLMGMIAVALAFITGVVNAGFRVGGALAKLAFTNYGDVLGAKAAIVAVMLALACYNRFVAMPKLCVTATEGGTQIAKLRASVAIELGLGILVLGVAAVLGVTPPPQ